MKRIGTNLFTGALALVVIVAGSPALEAKPPKGNQGPGGHLKIIEVWFDSGTARGVEFQSVAKGKILPFDLRFNIRACAYFSHFRDRGYTNNEMFA
jgi:hypothetical protein